MEKKQSFLEGALFLTLSVFLVKVIGALYKVPLSAIISEEGMGYFGTAYSFYNVLFSVAAAGLPVAVSRAVSEADAKGDALRVQNIRRAALPLFFSVGLFGFLFLVLAAPVFLRIVRNPGALPSLLCLSPSVLLCSMAAAYRGGFEGKRNMVPTAVSQVIEAFFKLTVGLTAARYVMCAPALRLQQNRTPWGAAAAISGVTVGAAFSVLYLFLKNRREERAYGKGRAVFKKQEKAMLTKALLRAALPVSLGAAAVSISGFIDASFLQARLMHTVTVNPEPLLLMYEGLIPPEKLRAPETVPNFLFGCYNMALTLFMLVPSVTQAFSVSALPNVSAAFSKGDRQRLKNTVETVLRLTFIFALPAGLGLSVFSGPIVKLLYGERMAWPIISRVLSVLGCAAVFSAAVAPLSSMLQAVGKTVLPVQITVFGLLVKVILNFVLVGLPEVNLLGGAIGSLVSAALTAVCLFTVLCRVLHMRVSLLRVAGKPFAAALVSVLSGKAALRFCNYFGFGARVSALVLIVTAVIYYAAVLVLLGAVTRADLKAAESCKNIEKT